MFSLLFYQKPKLDLIVTKALDFTQAVLDTELTFSRTSTALYRVASGELTSAATNAPRIDYSLTGQLQGMLIEPTSVNKMTDRNVNPTDTTGWTKAGDSAATFSIVSDPSGYLAGRKMTGIMSSGKLYKLDNSLGTTDAYAQSTASFGTTNKHTVSAYLAAVGGAATLTRSGTAPASLSILPASGFGRYALIVSPAAADMFRIVAAPGAVVYFIGAQIEELSFTLRDGTAKPTSLIPTNAASATRVGDTLTLLNYNSKPYFSPTQGSIVLDCIPQGFSTFSLQYLFCAQESTLLKNNITVRLNNDKGFIRRALTSNTVSQTQTSTHKPELGKSYRAALSWKPGSTLLFAQADIFEETTDTDPVNIDRVYFGTWRAGRDWFLGHLRSAKLSNRYRTAPQLGPDMFTAGDVAIIYSGQSNGYGHFRAQVDQDNSGETNALALMNQYITGPGRNWLLNGCTNGSLAYGSRADSGLPSATSAAYWYDDETNTLTGAAWVKFNNLVQAFQNAGGQILFTMWKQGDGGLSGFADKPKYKATLNTIFNAMAAKIPSNRILIDPLARYIEASESHSTQPVREVDWELPLERSDCFRGPECADLPIDDFAHLDDLLGYGVHGPRIMRKILKLMGQPITGAVDGAILLSATRVGTSVKLALQHDTGATDFTPTSGITGFRVFDGDPAAGAAEITVSAAVRSAAAEITLTLASAPTSGAARVCYIYNELSTTDYTKLVKDNSPYALPMHAAKILVV